MKLLTLRLYNPGADEWDHSDPFYPYAASASIITDDVDIGTALISILFSASQ